MPWKVVPLKKYQLQAWPYDHLMLTLSKFSLERKGKNPQNLQPHMIYLYSR